MNTATENNPESAISKVAFRVLKIATCPSLSGKLTLTYHIGCTPEAEIQFRVVANTASGFFSQEWVTLRTIQNVFDEVPAEKTITSFLLHALFRGKSVNTPAFLFAVLKNEGLVQPAKDKQRQYERLDPKGFLAEVKALIASGVDLKWDEPVRRKAKVADKAGDSASKTGATPAKTGAMPKKVGTKSAKTDASPPKTGATPATPGVKAANGVDIAEIVEVINAKVDANPSSKAQSITPEAKPVMPAEKTTAKTTRKTTAKAGK
jgi:hypothetical protein